MPLTTGTTIHGNTAFGPSGGRAVGHATRNSDGSFSNYRNADGTRMFGGNDRVFTGNSAGRGYDSLMARQALTEPVQRPDRGQVSIPAPAADGPLSAAVWPAQDTRIRYRAMPASAPPPPQPVSQPLRAAYVGLTNAPSLTAPMVARNDLARAVMGPVAWTKGRTMAFGNAIAGQSKRGLPTASQDRWAGYGGFQGFGGFR